METGLGGMGGRAVGVGGAISSYVWPSFAVTSSSSSYDFGRGGIGSMGVGAAAWKPAIEVWKSLEEQYFEMQEYSEEECTICLCEFDKGILFPLFFVLSLLISSSR
jgi:hypothetical protein